MNLKSFFKPGLFAFSFFMLCLSQNSLAQRTTISQANKGQNLGNGIQNQNTPDLALVDCKAAWLSPGQVSITWTARNIGTAICPLKGNAGENLVSYIVEGSSKDQASSTSGDWTQLTESSPLIAQTKELRPGDTATGNFTFDSSSKTGLVCYRVTLNTDRTGIAEKSTANNIYIGRIPR